MISCTILNVYSFSFCQYIYLFIYNCLTAYPFTSCLIFFIISLFLFHRTLLQNIFHQVFSLRICLSQAFVKDCEIFKYSPTRRTFQLTRPSLSSFQATRVQSSFLTSFLFICFTFSPPVVCQSPLSFWFVFISILSSVFFLFACLSPLSYFTSSLFLTSSPFFQSPTIFVLLSLRPLSVSFSLFSSLFFHLKNRWNFESSEPRAR